MSVDTIWVWGGKRFGLGMGDAAQRRSGRRDGVLLALLFLSGAALAIPATAGAQEQQDGEPTVLDKIVITARKRAEDPQKVPIGLSVLEGEQLDVPKTGSNAGLARSVPNFSFVDLGGQAANFANIRGVGSFSPVASDDTSVVFYVDEVPLSVYGVAPSLLDTDRVEVLRGPQGTLFGRNTQGGAVSIVPRRPTFDREFSLTGEVGTDGYAVGQMIANGTIIPDTLAGRMALSWTHFDGDIPNIVAGGEDGGLDIGAARGTLLFTPDVSTEAILSFNYNKDESHSPRFLLRDAEDFPVSATDPRTEVDGEAYGVNFRLNHEFENFTFTSLSSVQHSRSTQLLDLTDGLVFSELTGLPAPFFNVPGADVADLDLGETSYLQEFRLSSLEDSEIAWTAGVNYFRSESSSDRDGHATTPAFLSVNGIQDNDFTTNSYAAFGEVTAPVMDRLKATLGFRATHEDKSASYRFDGNGLPGVVPAYASDGSLTDDFATGRAALSYEWTDDLMTYASLARGYVSAGFPAIAINSGIGKPEDAFPASKSWTYETGFKSALFDDRLVLNGSIFLNDVKDGHLAVFDASQGAFTTAALDYRSYGGELEATARVTPDLDVLGGIGYTHAELVNVPTGSLTGAKNGNDVPNVPALTANLGLQYRWAASAFGLPGEFVGRATYQYVASRAADVANSFDLRSYGLVNTRLTWQNGDLSIYAFANNLFDKRYETWGQSFGTIPTVRVGQGRVLGLGTTFQF